MDSVYFDQQFAPLCETRYRILGLSNYGTYNLVPFCYQALFRDYGTALARLNRFKALQNENVVENVCAFTC